jgi:hypothetical protein
MQQTQQAVLHLSQQQQTQQQQQQQQQPQLPQPPQPPQPPLQALPLSVPLLSSQQLLPPSAPPNVAFVPPISLNPASGVSLDRSFPHVESALRLAIAKHEFRPGHLYKLDAVKEKPKPKTFEISDDGEFTQRDKEASPKDYPSFRALFDPLVVYFEILQYFIASSGNVAAIQQVIIGCSEYLRILYQIYSRYE